MGGQSSHWNNFKNFFIEDGWFEENLFAYSFSQSNICTPQDNIENAANIETWINDILANTGKNKVDIIAFSMGGWSSRYYLKFLLRLENVDNIISIGTPHHQYYYYYYYYYYPSDENPVKFCFEEDYQSQEDFINFFVNLNQGDDTPGGILKDSIGERLDPITESDIIYNGTHIQGEINYVTIRSLTDEIVDPNTVILEGATNLEISGLFHLAMPNNESVYNMVRNIIVGSNTSNTKASSWCLLPFFIIPLIVVFNLYSLKNK